MTRDTRWKIQQNTLGDKKHAKGLRNEGKRRWKNKRECEEITLQMRDQTKVQKDRTEYIK